MIKEKKMISQLIFDRRHQGTVNVLWFEDDDAEREFIDFLEYARGLPVTTVPPKSTTSAAAKVPLFAYIPEDEVDVARIKGIAEDHINSGTEVLVLKNPDSDDAFYEMVLSLKQHKKPSIFLVDERVSSSFITDKIICVDREGEISDIFSPVIAEC